MDARQCALYKDRCGLCVPYSGFSYIHLESLQALISQFCHEMQIKPPSSQAGRFTQILSIGIGGSSLGPQFVSEALAPDNPPLKVLFQVLRSVHCGFIAPVHSVGAFHAASCYKLHL
jgi:hypothetical protein